MTVGQGIAALWPIFIAQSPVYVVWIVGIVLTLVFWRRHPRVSLFALLALALLLIVGVVGTFLGSYLPIALRQQGMTTIEMSRIVGITSVAGGLIGAAAAALLVVALFIDRPRRR